jgi:TP901 family phage tail tape measure protein
MPISARELFLIIRAKDEASRVLRGLSATMMATGASANAAAREATARANHMIQFGSALASAGAGAAIAGAGIEAALFSAARSAVEYNRQAALTTTQTDGVSNALNKVSDIGKRVGGDIGAPFDELQSSLFDIFSSMDVNVPQSERLLRGFAKSAVAGQTDIQTAGRATIALMNAYDIPVKNVNDVLDFQFRLVQKGVGTYEEFARTIGRSIPSAVRAGQSYETLGGMLAFMTRNGLSAAMASTSAGRAFDAMAHPETVKRLEKMGIDVRNANGEFRPMIKILGDLQGRFDDLTAPQRSKALYELFKGSGGTIQARRFFDSVLKDRGAVRELAGHIRSMADSSGILETKYTQMSDTLAVKAQLLANRWEIIKVSVGEQLLPVIERLIDYLGRAIEWWNGLDDSTRKNIVTWTAITGVALILFGVISALAGGIIMIAGAMGLMGISAGTALASFGLLTGGIGLLVYGFKEGERWAILLGGALLGIQAARTLSGIFGAISGSVGNMTGKMRTSIGEAQGFGNKLGTAVQGGVGVARGAMRGLMSFMGGPWGIAFAAGGILLANYLNNQREAAQRVKEHTDALDDQTGALTRNNRQVAVKALQDSGAFDAARKLGISLKTVTDAALGNEEAIRKVNQQTREHSTAFRKAVDFLPSWAQGMNDSEKAADKLRGAIGQSNTEVGKAREQWRNYKEAMGDAAGQAEATGGAIGRGLARGIANSSGLAIEQARQMVNKVNVIMAQTAETHSPSKVTERIGRDLDRGLVKGLKGGEQEVLTTAAELVDKIRAAYEEADKKVDQGLIAIVNTHKRRLAELGAELDAKKASFEQVYNSVISMGSVTGLGERSTTDAEGNTIDLAPTGAAIVEDLQARMAAAQQFAANLQRLKALGLNATTLAELAQAGADQAGAQAAALVAAGNLTIAEINRIQGVINAAAKTTARVGSEAMYQAGEAAAKAIKRGFRSQEKEILDEMERIAEKMVKKLKKELGISSPAKAMIPIGEQTIMGAVVGVQRAMPLLERELEAAAGGMLKPIDLGGSVRGGDQTIVTQLVVDSRVLAEVTNTRNQLDARR